MSKQVHCPECQSENTPGSKFCNNCGARMPKSTSILCPRCQTPNPHTNFYCDNCGGRLHAEQNHTAPEEETKPKASDLPTSAKMFTLPTRDPGNTGELDPSTLPDWLNIQGDESKSKQDTGKLPRLSDLTPEERSTAEDLPGWLISTENENLLIDSPDDITTEHFLHLIQDINEDEREKLSGLLSDPSIAGETANLPDWLKQVAQPKPESSPPPAEETPSGSTTIEEDEAAWLLDSDATDEPSSQTPPEEIGQQDPDEVPDWLGELGPPRTAMLGKADSQTEQPQSESQPEESDLPDWLSSSEDSPKAPVDSLAADDIFSNADLLGEDIPDWMLGDEQIALDSPTQSENVPQEETLDDLTLDAAASTSLTGWLAEFDVDDDSVEETAVTPEEIAAPQEPDEGETQRSLTDWLTDFEAEDDTEETAVTLEDTEIIDNSETERSLTNWLSAFDEEDLVPDDEPSEPIQEEESLPDWLTGIDAATAAAAAAEDNIIAEPVSEPEETSDITLDDEMDWLTAAISNETPKEQSISPVEEDEETEDWLDFDVTADASLSTGNTGPLPGWLDELESTTNTPKSFDTSELDTELEGLFGEQVQDGTGDLSWLDEEIDDHEAEPESLDSSLAPLVGSIGAAAVIGITSQDDDADLDDNPDWLSELAAFDPNEQAEILEEETAVSEPIVDQSDEESEFDFEAAISATESTDLDDYEFDEALLSTSGEESGGWSDIDGILAGTADDDALPDWLEQLDDAPESEITEVDQDEAPPEEIPNWVANMRPDDTGQLSSALPSALFLDSDTSELLSETGDLADAELPEWLDESIDQRVTTAEQTQSTSWFDPDRDGGDTPAELEAILADLPPSQAPEDMLQKAEIPDWLEELKPRELTGEAIPIPDSRLESSGPLAGMPNTIGIEPIIAMPRVGIALGTYAISSEQAQQARLLRQLAQEDSPPPAATKAAISVRSVAGLRIIVAILMLVAILIGLYGPTFLKSKTLSAIPVPASSLNQVITDNSGKTVLVAFEYTPALAGELNHEAETLLAQLAANNSPILTMSQYVAGTAVAEAVTAPYEVTSLGLIPGEAMGLRQLGECLGENAIIPTCSSLHSLSVGEETAGALADVGLIIVLTGERSSLINWVEQVGTSTTVPIVVGTTQSLEPMVVPYYASAQVSGYLNGLPATVAYQQAFVEMTESPAKSLYGAQSLVLLVTAVILLIGGLTFGSTKKK